MKNIYVLPTDKPSTLYYLGKELKLRYVKDLPVDSDIAVNQHIYITNGEEIKEGDWVLFISTNEVIKVPLGGFKGKVCKKIILTTDQDLINDGIEQISENTLLKIVEHINSGKNIEYFDEL